MSALARSVEGVGKYQTSCTRLTLSIPAASPGLSCHISVLSTFKATYDELHQWDRNSEIHAHFSVCPLPSITSLQQSYPDLPVSSIGPWNYPRFLNLPVQYLDKGWLPSSDKRRVSLKVIKGIGCVKLIPKLKGKLPNIPFQRLLQNPLAQVPL